jgi:hypothetical protein
MSSRINLLNEPMRWCQQATEPRQQTDQNASGSERTHGRVDSWNGLTRSYPPTVGLQTDTGDR